MTTLKSVPTAEDAKERKQSDVRFPYYNLDASVEVALVMHREAGGKCDRSQLASFLNYKGINNGSFLTRVTAAKLFGFIGQNGNQLFLTPLGMRVAAPVAENDAARARVDAFFNVDLFKKVFDAYDGRTLPPELGLRNLLLTQYGVVEARVGPAVKVMLDSAEQAGMFRNSDRTRLVKPVFHGAAPEVRSTTPDQRNVHDGHRGVDVGPRHGGGGGGGGGQDESRIPRAIYGLVADLPPKGQLPSDERDELINAFTAAMKYLYPDRDAKQGA